MKAKPILFSGPMVRAILEGRKTQTRRVVKPQPTNDDGSIYTGRINGPEVYEPAVYDKHGDMVPGSPIFGIYDDHGDWGIKCPYGRPGDYLWVRETSATLSDGTISYAADGKLNFIRYSPSIHMPRKASRLTLRITNVRVERLQDISEIDAHNEGITLDMLPYNPDDPHPCRTWFRGLWVSINGPDSWKANPWVWVIEYEAIQANVDQVLRETA